MKRSTAKLVSFLAVVIGIVLHLILQLNHNKGAGTVVLVIMAVVVIFCNSFLACPKCGAHPGRSSWWAEYCPHCGEPLD